MNYFLQELSDLKAEFCRIFLNLFALFINNVFLV